MLESSKDVQNLRSRVKLGLTYELFRAGVISKDQLAQMLALQRGR